MTRLRLDGQLAVVTGAGRGLGRTWAQALAERGAGVVLVGRDPALHRETALATAIRAAGGRAWAERGDVTDNDAMQALAVRVLDAHGRVDILVNNAGMTRDRSFAKLDMADFRAVIDGNLIGTAQATAAFWPAMLAQGYGRVVFLTSSAGLAGNFGQAGYAAAKMGLVGLMQVLGLEGESKGVHVNCLSPIGATEMNAGLLPPDVAARFTPDRLVPGLLLLAAPAAPNRMVLMGGGGSFELADLRFTQGLCAATAEELLAGLAALTSDRAAVRPQSATTQLELELAAVKQGGDVYR